MIRNVMVIGGYGFFGRRIAESLVRGPTVNLFIAGRDRARALDLARELNLPDTRAVRADAMDSSFSELLRGLAIDVAIHTAGPFQAQDYRVARSAIEAGCHYIDLADGREFVTGIRVLDPAAREAGVSVVSGASSVPALSAAVVDRLAGPFDRLDSIRIGISSGARSPGLATVQGILSYIGRPFGRLQNGNRVSAYGWQDLIRHRFPSPVGTRLLGSCDVPDLDLLPQRHPGLRSVAFYGGYGNSAGHLLIWLLAGLVRAGLVSSVAPLARWLHRSADLLAPLVSEKGAMFVEVSGLAQGDKISRTWHLLAFRNHGPHIPCGAAIDLTRKLITGALVPGATPCVGLLTVDEYLAPLADLDIHEIRP
jgi:saccharopine dehydrogenase-like NADP-dependent oxidoreductase